MINPTEQQIKSLQKHAFFLEKHGYDDVRKYIKELPRPEFVEFWQFFLDSDLLTEIALHKNYLAMALASASKVKALPEDRKRLIFTFATFGNDFINLEQELKKEVGANFKLQKNYTFDKAVKSWQEIVSRAKEIKNGYFNLANLGVETQVASILRFFKMSTESDVKRIETLHQMADKVLAQAITYIYLPPSAPGPAQIMPQIIEFYKATNRLQLDIDKLGEAADLEEAIDYITIMNEIFQIKLSLAEKRVPINDYAIAEKEIRKGLSGDFFFANFLTTEEILRRGVALEPIV